MNLEDTLRSSLHNDADQVAVIPDLLETTIARGTRKQRVRRGAAVVGAVTAIGVVSAGAVIVADRGPSGTQTVKPAAGGPSAGLPAVPWWDTWTPNRHNGPVNQTFLTNVRPTYGTETQPENIKVWATGSFADGTDYAMFTSPTTGHQIEWFQGWNGTPDFGESTQTTTPGISWSSFATPTLAAHNNYQLHQEWLIVVGGPGTTGIEYARDGSDFAPMTMQDGIGVLKIDGYIPLSAKVELSDANGVYASGTPSGARPAKGAATPGAGDATPSTTPTAAVPVVGR